VERIGDGCRGWRSPSNRLIAPSGYLFAVKIRSRSGAPNDLIITSRRGLQRSIQFVAVRTACKLAMQIGLDSQSGPRFDADLTGLVNCRRRSGGQTNDPDRGQAFGSSADLTGPVNWRAGFRFGADRAPKLTTQIEGRPSVRRRSNRAAERPSIRRRSNWAVNFRRRWGPQTNDADRGQAFGSSQIEPGRKSAGLPAHWPNN
jgi:hypothetical protein